MLQFLNPALLIGAALFAVPLIIHLLNRQRFRRRQWAAMEFLLAAYKKQRKRLRRENLLLLLLRCAIPIVLALAIARPLLRDESGIAGTGTGSAHHVLVLDHSASMGLELAGATTPFDRAKDLATALLDRVGSRDGQNRITVVVQGIRPSVPLREEIDVERAKARIAGLGLPVDGGGAITDALAEAAEIVEESSDAEIRVHLFTDLQVRSLGTDPFTTVEGVDQDVPTAPTAKDTTSGDEPTGAMFEDTIADALKRIREKAEVNVFDVRGEDAQAPDNLQIQDLRIAQAHAIERVPLPVVVTVRNRTDSARDVQVTLEIDGGQPTRRSVRVEAGAEADAEFEVVLRETGPHRLRASLDGDALPYDDERFLVVDVRDRLRVLVVEGSSETDPGLQDATHLIEVLDPTGGEGAPDLTQFAPTVVDTVALLSGRVRPQDHDLVILADVPRLDRASSDALLEAVRGGTGLMVLFGRRTDPDSYNEYLHRGGTGPMPMALTGAQGFAPESERWFGSLVERRDHPLLRDFQEDIYVEILESVPIWRYVGAERPPESAGETGETSADDEEGPQRVLGEVVLSIRDAERSPLWVASRFGAGKALFATTPISRAPERWNRLDAPVAGLSFLLLWPAAEWLTVPAIDAHNVEVGGALTSILDSRPTDIAVLVPEDSGAGKIPVGEDATPLLGGRYALPPFRRTEQAGFYEVEMMLDETGGGSGERHVEEFAVCPDATEGELLYLSHESARERLGVEAILTALPSRATSAVDAGADELGPLFLWLTLLFLLGEAALARFVTRRRA
ncbi:MAG: BatA domain-containing protein [Planctomycetota bacterium]|nr:BatA domain-containing protein [Planctomycetota bacterium]